MSQEQDKKFQDEIQSYLRGEAECSDATLKHFVGRFGEAQAELEGVAKNVQGLESQIAEGRTNIAKLQGFLEGLAVDLRTLWNKQNDETAQPEIIDAQ